MVALMILIDSFIVIFFVVAFSALVIGRGFTTRSGFTTGFVGCVCFNIQELWLNNWFRLRFCLMMGSSTGCTDAVLPSTDCFSPHSLRASNSRRTMISHDISLEQMVAICSSVKSSASSISTIFQTISPSALRASHFHLFLATQETGYTNDFCDIDITHTCIYIPDTWEYSFKQCLVLFFWI